MSITTTNGSIVMYESENGDLAIDVQLKDETVWLSQKQMALLLGKNTKTISEHIINIYAEQELQKDRTVRKFRIVQMEGKREVAREIDFYNLDVIISVGYRVKSQEGTQFRIWATQKLRDYLIHGYTLNQKQLQEKGLDELSDAIQILKQTMETQMIGNDEAKGLLTLITEYAQSWLLFQKYDEGNIETPKNKSNPDYVLVEGQAVEAMSELRQQLMSKGEATELFGNERSSGVLGGIVGNLYQTFDGSDLYLSIEEKSSHLLYFIIKDHPFTDGNKRIGSFLFLLFLSKNNYLLNAAGERKFNDNALVALTLMVASSDPKQKETIIRLIMQFVSG